jgi:hypothetical protein
VLCNCLFLGRARLHPGNEVYRRYCTSVRGLYNTVPKKSKRMAVDLVIQQVFWRDPPGRFVEAVDEANEDGATLWREIPISRIRDKISQTIRDQNNARSKLINKHDPQSAEAGPKMDWTDQKNQTTAADTRSVDLSQANQQCERLSPPCASHHAKKVQIQEEIFQQAPCLVTQDRINSGISQFQRAKGILVNQTAKSQHFQPQLLHVNTRGLPVTQVRVDSGITQVQSAKGILVNQTANSQYSPQLMNQNTRGLQHCQTQFYRPSVPNGFRSHNASNPMMQSLGINFPPPNRNFAPHTSPTGTASCFQVRYQMDRQQNEIDRQRQMQYYARQQELARQHQLRQKHENFEKRTPQFLMQPVFPSHHQQVDQQHSFQVDGSRRFHRKFIHSVNNEFDANRVYDKTSDSESFSCYNKDRIKENKLPFEEPEVIADPIVISGTHLQICQNEHSVIQSVLVVERKDNKVLLRFDVDGIEIWRDLREISYTHVNKTKQAEVRIPCSKESSAAALKRTNNAAMEEITRLVKIVPIEEPAAPSTLDAPKLISLSPPGQQVKNQQNWQKCSTSQAKREKPIKQQQNDHELSVVAPKNVNTYLPILPHPQNSILPIAPMHQLMAKGRGADVVTNNHVSTMWTQEESDALRTATKTIGTND